MENNTNVNYGQKDYNFESENMYDKEPGIDQYQGERNSDNNISDNYSGEQAVNDTSDPYFQKNASIAQDLLGDNDNDPNRRTLDEYDANDAEPDEDDDDLEVELEEDTDEEE